MSDFANGECGVRNGFGREYPETGSFRILEGVHPASFHLFRLLCENGRSIMPVNISAQEFVDKWDKIQLLDDIHQALDTAVFNAYGWPHDLSDKEILERLLTLNL